MIPIVGGLKDDYFNLFLYSNEPVKRYCTKKIIRRKQMVNNSIFGFGFVLYADSDLAGFFFYPNADFYLVLNERSTNNEIS